MAATQGEKRSIIIIKNIHKKAAEKQKYATKSSKESVTKQKHATKNSKESADKKSVYTSIRDKKNK